MIAIFEIHDFTEATRLGFVIWPPQYIPIVGDKDCSALVQYLLSLSRFTATSDEIKELSQTLTEEER